MAEMLPFQLVLPDADHPPAVLPQQPVLKPVACFVSFDLGLPPCPPGDGNFCPCRMPVPELAVHKHRNLSVRKHKVGSHQQDRITNREPQLPVTSPAGDSLLSEKTNHRQLGSPVSRRPDQRHHFGSLGFCEDIRHSIGFPTGGPCPAVSGAIPGAGTLQRLRHGTNGNRPLIWHTAASIPDRDARHGAPQQRSRADPFQPLQK